MKDCFRMDKIFKVKRGEEPSFVFEVRVCGDQPTLELSLGLVEEYCTG